MLQERVIWKDLNIILDPKVRHVTPNACRCLSWIITEGVGYVNNVRTCITIYKDKVDFGRCFDENMNNIQGVFHSNFYKEYEDIVYHYEKEFKYSMWSHQLDYTGKMSSSQPVNPQLCEILYKKFA